MIASAFVETAEERFLNDPVMKLAMASVLFDPAVGLFSSVGQSIHDGYTHNEVISSLTILREKFPAEYAGLLQDIQECDDDDLAETLMALFNELLPGEIEELEFIEGGYLPYDLWGYYTSESQSMNGWTHREFYGDATPLYLELETLLGDAFNTGAIRHIKDSLYAQRTDLHDNIAHLIEWISSSSGNVLFDYAYDDEWPVQAPTLDDYDLLWEETLDAEKRFYGARLAAEIIITDPVIYANLIGNIIMLIGVYTDQHLEKYGMDWRSSYAREYTRIDVPLEWVQPFERSRCTSTDAQIDDQVLRFWRDAPDERRGISG